MRQFFSNIKFVKGFDGPARVNRLTGELQLNPDVWHKLTDDAKNFIMAHELGHYYLQTTDEKKADAFADWIHEQQNLSLKQSIKSMTLFLSSDNPEHRERVQLQLMRALNRDAESGNQKAKNILQQLQCKPMNTNLMQARLGAEDTSDFLGIGKKAKQRKQQRADDKTDRKAARNDLIRAKAHAARTYADKGLVVPKTDIAGIAKSVLGAAGNVAGAMTGLNLTQQNLATETDSAGVDTRTNTFIPGAQQQPQKNNTMLFVGIAVVVLAIIAVFVFKKKKK